MAPPKKTTTALLKEEGLERTDNNLRTHSWPVIPMINQKNYYTEYLKRDDQIMVLREQAASDPAVAQVSDEVEDQEEEVTRYGSKIIVIHPGSQNLRIGFASDALPKSIPNVIAKKATHAEFEVEERCPKRVRLDEDGDVAMDDDDERVGPVEKEPEFDTQINAMSTELKQKMRSNKRRMLPNSKELVLSYNRRTVPETIKEHNDPYRVEWTEVSADKPKEYYVGQEALRIPDTSKPRYKLHWPIRHGWLNERDYKSKRRLMEDIQIIIEEGIKNELGLEKKELVNYRAVLVVPDLYERNYVTDMVELLMKEIRFAECCIIQESLAASFGAGFSQACIVDVGAQKTSVCCIDEGMCVAESRINIKYGGFDVTELLFRLLLQNSFPYKSINLQQRYDFLLAEELKCKLATLNDGDVSVATHDFHLRRPDKNTKKYTFRVYDEVYLAPLSHFTPTLLNHSHKLSGRRSLWERSYDIYDSLPNDPMSTAQAALFQSLSTKLSVVEEAAPPAPRPFGAHLNPADGTPHSSAAGSPDPAISVSGGAPANPHALWEEYDATVPIQSLERAVIDSISHAAKGDEKKMRDFFAGIMVVGGGGAVPGFRDVLEERIRNELGRGDVQILIGVPPRELDCQVIVWKGASVFGKLRHTNDSWVKQKDYDMLGNRVLTLKCMWNF
jgi:actin-related protein 8